MTKYWVYKWDNNKNYNDKTKTVSELKTISFLLGDKLQSSLSLNVSVWKKKQLDKELSR